MPPRLSRRFTPTREPGVYFIDMLLDEAKQGGHTASIDRDRGIYIGDEVACTASDTENPALASVFCRLAQRPPQRRSRPALWEPEIARASAIT